jgi:hypothetical protein
MRIITIAFLLCVSVTTIQAQKFSIRYSLGVANYAGDLQAKAYTFDQCQLAGGLGLHYEISDHFTARADFYLGKVSAADRHSGIPSNVARNLEFTSNIEDFTLSAEYDLLSLKKWKATPYIFAGFGVYHFDPYTSDQLGDKIYLRPLGTEGQGVNGSSKYNLTQLNIPYGAGIKVALSEDVRLGVEVGFRKLFTDYLDDVSGTYYTPYSSLSTGAQEYAYRGSGAYPGGSKRGNSGNNDDYYFTQLTLSVRLVSHKESDFTKMQMQMIQCPTNVILY